ncbi:MAG: hypothetical protein ABI040_01720, partial [Rhodoferax sp.]
RYEDGLHTYRFSMKFDEFKEVAMNPAADLYPYSGAVGRRLATFTPVFFGDSQDPAHPPRILPGYPEFERPAT